MDPQTISPLANKPAVKDLRRWPAIVISLLVLAAITLPTMVAPGTMFQFFGMMMGPMVGAALLILWWLFASRRPTWLERTGGVVFVVVAAVAAYVIGDKSMLMVLMVRGTTSVILVTTVWFVIARSLAWKFQLAGAAGTVVVVLGIWCVLRMDGVNGAITPQLTWRWSPTKEQQYVSSLQDQRPKAIDEPDSTLLTSPGDWLGFRGADRDGRLEGVTIETNWNTNRPSEVWRRPIGPAWSSFAVVGDRIYTQEQRDQVEVVLCLSADTGEEIWSHGDESRFWESMAGAGPRATPTFAEGRIYALGANGILNCLDAVTGKKQWSANVKEDGNAKVPEWGFASSPLVVDDTVFVYAGGGLDHGLIAYDRLSGDVLWQAGNGTHSYSSPQFASFSDTRQVLMLTERGVFSVAPDSGNLLWDHEWLIDMNRTVQPNVDGNRVFLGTGFGNGTRSVSVDRSDEGWRVEEDWTSRAIKPYFNDFVVFAGHLYGFDGNIFACVEIETGQRRWKRGRYGNGQVLLIADQGLLLILSEKGDVVLVSADSKAHEELGRFSAIQGKTWNHPVIAHGKLFVRNAEEAACFALATPASSQ